MFKNGQLVLAQCQDYPYWPGKVLEYNSASDAYKVLFCGEKSYADISADCIINFTEEECRKIANSNRNNKELIHSIRLAMKKFKKKQKNPNSSSSEVDFNSDQPPVKTDITPKSKPQKPIPPPTSNSKQQRDPLTELITFLELLMKDIMELAIQSKPVILTAEEQLRLRYLLQSNSVPLFNLIESRVIQKIIMIIKAYRTFKLWCADRQAIMTVIQTKFSEYKAGILSENVMCDFNLTALRKQNIIFKVNNFKANL